jgi:hypothetical protein
MIFITGDIHGDIDIGKLSQHNWTLGKCLGKRDYLIIVGDFGLVWDLNKSGKTEIYWTKWLSEKPWTTLFLDGNHENFSRLNKLPTTEMFGSEVGILNENIFHLKRGNIYTIEDKTFFTLGGGYSVDKVRRIPFISWWPEEVPSYKERERALNNLAKVNNTVDYIITHVAATSILKQIDKIFPIIDEFNNFLEEFILKKVSYRHWCFAHYHDDVRVDFKHTCLFEKIIEIK